MGVFRRQWPGVSYGRGEDWHYVGEAGEPAFQNSWHNVSGSMGLAFRIRESGVVDIQGRISGGTTTSVVFTLPEGYRPSGQAWFTAFASSVSFAPDTPVLIVAETSGDVLARNLAVWCGVVWMGGQFFLNPPAAAP